MALDRWIAVIFLMTSLVYGLAAYDYPLLPFERNMSFLPNTMPKMLSGAGAILSLIIIFVPGIGHAVHEEESADEWNNFDWIPAGGLVLAMVLFALALRPLGFIGSSVLFLVGAGWILGERKIHLMVPIALLGSGLLWYLVQELLGIFLRPLPWFLT
jgi:putative tricarboxylic transport membrane protein